MATTPPPQPPPYPPYPQQQSPYYQPPPQRTLERLTFRQKIILGGVMIALLLTFGIWNSCSTKPVNTGVKLQTPGFIPPNPQTIESQHEQAEREYAAAKARADALSKQVQNGPTTTAGPTATGTAQQNPDAQFLTEIRHQKWRREIDAPFASGVGFPTRQPAGGTEQRQERVNNTAGQEQQMGNQPTVTQAQPTPQEPKNPSDPSRSPEAYTFNQAEGPLHRLDEETIIPTTLLNELDGEFAGPVVVQVSEPVYDASGLNLLIPAGSKVIGEAKAVSTNNQRRLAVPFHRIVMPDGYSLSLDHFPGLDQVGATALKDKVNNHYLSTFGMAMAVGAIAGLAQIGNNGRGYSPYYGFREGVTQQVAITSQQIMERYLNRPPTITIRPGTRVKIILTTDLPGIPEYAHHAMPVNR